MRKVTPPATEAVAAPIAMSPNPTPQQAGPKRVATPPPAPKRAPTPPPHLRAVKAPEPEAAPPEAPAVAAVKVVSATPVAAPEPPAAAAAAAVSALAPPPPAPEPASAAAPEVAPATPVAAPEVVPATPPVAAPEPQAAAPTELPVIAAAPAVVAEPATASDEDVSYVIPARRHAPTKWLIASAALCLVSGVGLGLVAMRALVPQAASAAPAAVAPAAVAPTLVAPAAEPAATTPTPEPAAAAPAAEPAAATPTAEPAAVTPVPAAASSSALPWDDQPPATAKTCQELAPLGSGPKGFMLQQAVTSAQRALLHGDTAAAHSAFCTAAQLGVPSDTVLLGLTQVLLMQSDFGAALKTIDQLLERTPSSKQALDWRGDILIRLGRVDEAKLAWFKAAGASRASKRLVDNLVKSSDTELKLALRSGDLSRADRMLRRVIALTSGDPEHSRQLVTVLTKSGNTAAAERWRAYVSALGG